LENAEKERAKGPKNGFFVSRGRKQERAERHEENVERERAAGLKKESSLALEPMENRTERHQTVQPPKVIDAPKRVDPPKIAQPPRMVDSLKVAIPPKMVPPPAPVRTDSPRPAPVHTKPDRMRSDLPLVSLFQPGSLGAEQFRRLRTHVLRLNASNPPKTIMVTSATAGEGKTFVAANLAAGIAHDLHFHALLVDCDLRSPSLSQWFGIQNGHGLSDYLVGRGQLSELLMKTEMEKLTLLTGGSAQAKPTELIGSRKMEALVRELKSRYNDRYIILDATPLLATTEPEVLARLVDGILVVVRAGVTPRETVKQAIAPLDPTKILGFVLNDVEFKSPGLSSRYFGSDGYYTQYGYGKKRAEPRSPAREVSPFKKKSD
jgi:exopolysaccharide/PEP-CTERM locus tyrosine autokinase